MTKQPDKKDKSKGWRDLYWKSHKYNERVKIKSGTYLDSFCPFCEKELTKENELLLEVVNPDDQSGAVSLSPYLNVFERNTHLHLPKGKNVKDVKCPHCHESLVREDVLCGICASPSASFMVRVSTEKVPFYICTKVGCTWHSISNEDESKLILDDSDEW